MTEIQRNLSQALVRRGVEVTAFGAVDAELEQMQKEWSPVDVNCFPIVGPKSFGYSPGLHNAIRTRTGEFDVLHLHCLWLDTSRIALSWKLRSRKPLIVSINGFLEKWALGHHSWRKKIASLLYERRMLESADVLHANTEKEFQDIRSFGLNNRIEVIPNGVKQFDYVPYESSDGIHRISFLGRLHEKKGIIRFLEAWARVPRTLKERWRITIAGWEDSHYSSLIKTFIDRHKITAEVDIEGPKYGRVKNEFIRNSAAMFLTSQSEGMPMSALECFAHGRLLLMTRACNIDVRNFERAAVTTDQSIESIQAGIEQILQMNEQQRHEANVAAWQLARDRFCWDKVAKQWQDVYSSV